MSSIPAMPATRDLDFGDPPPQLEPELPAEGMAVRDRWAVIVGISRYKHEGLDLRFAHRDAEAMYDLLQRPEAGAFRPDHMVLLIDAEATTASITRALREFLQKPARDDLVLVYLACHGAPDPNRPENVYLITHDTNPREIVGTALPMREIDLSLRENLRAQWVVIIADTCHSAAIGGGIGRRAAADQTTVVNRYLQNLSRARPGTALLTSAEANETSVEDERWGGGHGVFTHFVLEGMRGAADAKPRNGVVTVGELFEYVRTAVMEATDYTQHPCIGTSPYDRDLPMAVVPDAALGTAAMAAGASPGRSIVPTRAPSAAPRSTPLALPSYRPAGKIAVSGRGVRALDFIAGHQAFAAAETDGYVALYPGPDGGTSWPVRFERGPACAVAGLADGRTLAAAGTAGALVLVDLRTGRAASPPGDGGPLLTLAAHPERPLVAAAGEGGIVTLWEAPSLPRWRSWDAPTAVSRFETRQPVTHAVAFGGGGRTLVAAGSDGSLRQWDVETGAPRPEVRGHESAILCLASEPARGLLATGSRDTTARLRDASGVVTHTLRGHERPVYCLAFAPGGRVLATGGADGRIILWDVLLGTPLRTFHLGPVSVQALAYDARGEWIVAADSAGLLRWWAISATVPGRFLSA